VWAASKSWRRSHCLFWGTHKWIKLLLERLDFCAKIGCGDGSKLGITSNRDDSVVYYPVPRAKIACPVPATGLGEEIP
jgi:hypothetical protein